MHENRQAHAPGAWVTVPRPRPLATVRLLCIPYAGGGASSYSPWIRLLPDWLELRTVAPPGREQRWEEEPVRTMEDYVGSILAELLADRSLPLAIFGHSLGAVVGYELALRLAEHRYPPLHLVLSGCAFPSDLPAAVPLFRLPDHHLVEAIRRDYGGFPKELEGFPELLQHVRNTVRADLEVIECFRPRFSPILDVPVTLLWSEEDSSLSRESVLGWKTITRGPVSDHAFPGNHFYLIESAADVIATISNRISMME